MTPEEKRALEERARNYWRILLSLMGPDDAVWPEMEDLYEFCSGIDGASRAVLSPLRGQLGREEFIRRMAAIHPRPPLRIIMAFAVVRGEPNWREWASRCGYTRKELQMPENTHLTMDQMRGRRAMQADRLTPRAMTREQYLHEQNWLPDGSEVWVLSCDRFWEEFHFGIMDPVLASNTERGIRYRYIAIDKEGEKPIAAASLMRALPILKSRFPNAYNRGLMVGYRSSTASLARWVSPFMPQAVRFVVPQAQASAVESNSSPCIPWVPPTGVLSKSGTGFFLSFPLPVTGYPEPVTFWAEVSGRCGSDLARDLAGAHYVSVRNR
jgi:hypothetical protein